MRREGLMVAREGRPRGAPAAFLHVPGTCACDGVQFSYSPERARAKSVSEAVPLGASLQQTSRAAVARCSALAGRVPPAPSGTPLMAALSGEVGVPDQDVLEQELEELLRYVQVPLEISVIFHWVPLLG